MDSNQWKTFKSILSGESDELRAGLIVDSPWIPGYCGVPVTDFYAISEVWFDSYAKIKKDFPDIIFLPDWWAEYGMAAEPSGFGTKLSFYDSNLPSVHHFDCDTDDMEDFIKTLKVPDPRKDGLMPFLLSLQRNMVPRLRDIGEEIKIVNTRGPMTVAAHLFSVTELLLCAKIDPDVYHKLLEITTPLCIEWLSAQLEAAPDAEGILVLDDITGFFNKNDYEEFAHPYLKRVFDAFPAQLKLFHDDNPNDTPFPHVASLGVDLFNFTHEKDIGSVRRQTGPSVTLLGNIPPMSLVNNSPDEVFALAKDCINQYAAAAGSTKGLLLSVGGGAPMGAKGECIDAMLSAVKQY